MNEESLFAEALEIPDPSRRRAFLDRACAGDDALRTRVERLLEAHHQTYGLLEGQDRLSLWPTFVAEAAPSHGPTGVHVGALLAGRYTLVEEIGVGGMGTVWLAEQSEPVRRPVAVKLVKAGMDSRTVLARFEAERQALALMDHPNIAKVHDGGTTEAGGPFFVMEFVRGVPITRYCDDARLSIEERLALLVPVCQAVQHAHTKGIVHRDLKPGNILVTLIDGVPVPKVIDFGLAKALQEPLTERTLQTAHGSLMGTPLYMSPEQAELNNIDIDARADVYALGVIFFELLTGSTPLEERRLRSAGWHEMLRLIREEDSPRPSARLTGSESLPSLAACRRMEPLRLTRRVQGELDWIALKCLEKDRARRYETAEALARDVQRFLADESVEACPPSAGYRLRKFISRNRWAMLAVATILVLLAGGIIGTSWGLVRADKALKAESARADREWKANRHAEKAIEILASVFQDLDPDAEQKQGRPLRAILGERLDQAAAALDGDAVGDPLLVARMQDRLGRTYRGLGHSAKAEALFAKAAASFGRLLAPDAPETLAVLSRQASALLDVGEGGKAVPLYEKVRAAQARTLGPEHRDTLGTENALGIALWKTGKLKASYALLTQVRDVLTKHFGPDDRQTVNTLYNLSIVCMLVGKYEEAVEMAERVRNARVKEYGPEHVLSVEALHNLAARYAGATKMRKALALMEEARDVILPKLGDEHPTSLNVLDGIARLYRAFGRNKEAVALAERVRDARVRTGGAYHPDTIYSLNNLGSCYQADGQTEQAGAALLQSAVGLEKLGFIHPAGDQIIWTLCDFYEVSSDFDRADEWRRKWLAELKRRFGQGSPAYATELARLGDNLVMSGRPDRAEPYLREGLGIFREKEPDSDTAALARSNLGAVLLGRKKFEEAEPLLIDGYNGLKAHESDMSPVYARFRLGQSGKRVVKLYEDWGRPDKAAEWREKLGIKGGTPTHASAPHHGAASTQRPRDVEAAHN